MRLLPCGDRALLAEFDTLPEALATYAAWSANPAAGVLELVPAARTVLVRIDPRVIGLGHLEHWLSIHRPESGAALTLPAAELVTIPVVYDGPDLDDVAQAWKCSPDAVIARHLATEWVCGFIGFVPGFAYLIDAAGPGVGAPPPVPRRATSRPRVAAGSVGLAAEYCGMYPRASPGGWQLIGTTTAELWDAERTSPALITPGTRVRFTREPS